MRKFDRDKIIEQAKTLSDEELEKAYYDSVYDSLGTQTDKMYELGYDLRDIQERERYEKWLSQKVELLEQICNDRGITLWDRK